MVASIVATVKSLGISLVAASETEGAQTGRIMVCMMRGNGNVYGNGVARLRRAVVPAKPVPHSHSHSSFSHHA